MHIYHLTTDDDAQCREVVRKYGGAVLAKRGSIYGSLTFGAGEQKPIVVIMLPDGTTPEDLGIQGATAVDARNDDEQPAQPEQPEETKPATTKETLPNV